MLPEHLAFLAGAAQPRRCKAGDVLFRQGEHADRFFLVRSGEITVEVPAIMGPALQLQKLSNGKLLGWSWLIAPYRWDFQARASPMPRSSSLMGQQSRPVRATTPGYGCQAVYRPDVRTPVVRAAQDDGPVGPGRLRLKPLSSNLQ
jgi:hypothetical protein